MSTSSLVQRLNASPSPFIGRQSDVKRMLDLLKDPSVHLVTVLGVGGVGKTRFVQEVASFLKDQFQDGILFVPLASLQSGERFLPGLAEILNIQLSPGGDLPQAVLDHLACQQALLILDNFEHLLENAVFIGEILAAAPQIKVLVTSREKLNLASETLFHLTGLELPPVELLDHAELYDSLRLFLQKAKQARPGFSLSFDNTPSVIRICQLVDGNPLGILLAAAWIEHFSPEEIVSQITSSLDFLARRFRDAEPRHSSMRAVFDASFHRLSEPERSVLRKLAVFPGSFDLPAAQAVAGADLTSLITLVEKSLLTRDPGTGRYDLHELLRQYAGGELAANAYESTRLAHAHYFAKFIQQCASQLISPAQNAALDAIQADFENIRQACAVLSAKREFAPIRLALPGLYAFCDMRSRFYEGEAIFWQVVEGLRPPAGEPPHPAWTLALLSWYDLRTYNQRSEPRDQIASQAQRCLEQALVTHDDQGVAASLVLIGAIAEDQGNFETAILKYEEAMQTDPSLDDVYWVNMRIGLCRQAVRQYPEAIRSFQMSLQRGQETGERVKIGWSLLNIGDTLLLQKSASEAEGPLEQARVLFQETATPFGMLWSNYSLSRAALQLGNLQRARQHADIAGRIARQIHSAPWIAKADALLTQIDAASPRPTTQSKCLEPVVFSQRELEVLHLLKSPMSGPEMARQLYVSLNTIRYHTKNIYQKLGVKTRLEAIRRAEDLGL